MCDDLASGADRIGGVANDVLEVHRQLAVSLNPWLLSEGLNRKTSVRDLRWQDNVQSEERVQIGLVFPTTQGRGELRVTGTGDWRVGCFWWGRKFCFGSLRIPF